MRLPLLGWCGELRLVLQYSSHPKFLTGCNLKANIRPLFPCPLGAVCPPKRARSWLSVRLSSRRSPVETSGICRIVDPSTGSGSTLGPNLGHTRPRCPVVGSFLNSRYLLHYTLPVGRYFSDRAQLEDLGALWLRQGSAEDGVACRGVRWPRKTRKNNNC